MIRADRGAQHKPLAPPRPSGLSAGNFRKIAVNGFGDPHNSYAWSSAWFDDHIYVGTNRDLLATLSMFPYELPMPVWPVPKPESRWVLDLRGQLLVRGCESWVVEKGHRSASRIRPAGFVGNDCFVSNYNSEL